MPFRKGNTIGMETRFKPGVSGNPLGALIGRRAFQTAFDNAMFSSYVYQKQDQNAGVTYGTDQYNRVSPHFSHSLCSGGLNVTPGLPQAAVAL